MAPFVLQRASLRISVSFAMAWLVALLGVGCAGGAPGGAEKSRPAALPSTGNAELDRLIAKEIEPDSGGPKPLPESLPYRGSLPFAYTFTAEEGVDRFDMELGSADNVLSCYVYPDEVELGVTAVRLAVLFGEVLEKQVAPFPRRSVQQVVAGVAGRNAYHGVVWLWGDQKGFAQPKAIAGDAAGHGVACVHLGLGYRQTLIDTLEHLMTSLERSSPVPAPYFEEVVLSELDGFAVGITRLRMYLDDAGDTEIRVNESTLIPTSGDSIGAEFGFKHSWSRPDGTLINAYAYAADQKEDVTKLNLDPDQDRWRVKGTFQGKALDQLLEHREAIDSTRSEYLGLARRLRPGGQSDELTLAQWLSDVDPTRLTTTKLAVDPDDPSRLIAEVGPLRMEAERGPEGFIDRGTVPVAARTLSMRVLHRAGAL